MTNQITIYSDKLKEQVNAKIAEKIGKFIAEYVQEQDKAQGTILPLKNSKGRGRA